MLRRILNPWTQKEGYNCFGCCPTNPLGLHMEFFEDGDDVVSIWSGMGEHDARRHAGYAPRRNRRLGGDP